MTDQTADMLPQDHYSLPAEGERTGRSRAMRVPDVFVPLALMAADILGFLGSYLIMVHVGGLQADRPFVHQALIAMAVVFISLLWSKSLYPGYQIHSYEQFRRRTVAAVEVGLTSSLCAALIFTDWVIALQMAIFMSVAFCVQLAVGSAFRSLIHRIGWWGREATLISEPGLALVLTGYFNKHWQYGIRPVEWRAMSSAGARRSERADVQYPKVAVIASDDWADIGNFKNLDRQFSELVILADLPHLKVSGLQPVETNGCIGLRLRTGRQDTWRQISGRIIDIVVAASALAVTAPVILSAAAAIWIIDPGPVIYRQERVGRGGRTVRILKLRTMFQDADARLAVLLELNEAVRQEWLSYFKLRRDPRVLPVVGRVLRITSIDELPQFINVIMGDMRLIGPRPFPPYHLASLDEEFCRKRRSVTPGVTGLWQITERSNADIELQRQLDEYYIDNRSFWLDLHIIACTLPAVIKGSGAH